MTLILKPPVTIRDRYGFSLERCVVADIENNPGRWCCGFYGLNRDRVMTPWQVDGDRGLLAHTLDRLATDGRILVTFNGDHYDIPVIRAILGGFDPYAVGDAIIKDRPLPIPFSRLPALACDHVDLAARVTRGSTAPSPNSGDARATRKPSFPSLKLIAAYLGRSQLRELPYPPGTILTDEQWEEVKRYNLVDLGHTWALLNHFAPELESLAALSAEQGRDLRSIPTPKVVERVFLDAYERESGGRPPRAEEPLHVIYRGVEGVRRPLTPEAARWYDQVVDVLIPMGGNPEFPKPQVARGLFKIGDLTISVKKGGLHTIDTARVHYSTPKHRLFFIDASSFYPSLIATKGITPHSYGDCGAEIYRAILERRLATKAQAEDAARGPEERRRLKVQADALKLVLNSTFGKLGDRFSSLYDPAAFLAVTLSGQIMLIDLIERLVMTRGVKVLSGNTDGLFIKVRRKNRHWATVLREWEADTGMTLAVDPLKRLAILATNRFATINFKGKIKRKGAGVRGNITPLNTPNRLIVADAVVNALLKDVPPERTIRECTDPVRFCSVTKRTKKVLVGVMIDDADRSETPLGKVNRWYKAKDSTRRLEHRYGEDEKTGKVRHTTPAHAKGIALASDLVDGQLPADVDFSYYIGEARKAIQKVPGYHHLSPRRLQDHPTALDLVARGLVPIPKRGKAVSKGSDRSLPTYLWDWSSYATFGTYTGPQVGILVIDIDDVGKWKKRVDRNNSPLLTDRWRDFAGALVSFHGDISPEQVRSGTGRGKIILRFVATANHPLAKIAINHWLKGSGVEVFYGKGMPSIVGDYPDGGEYQLDGVLTDAPAWLIAELTPKTRPPKAPKELPVEPVVIDDKTLGELRDKLGTLEPKLAGPGPNWEVKDQGDKPPILVCDCPYHRGSRGCRDMSAGFGEDGLPYIHCFRASCDESQILHATLREQWWPATPVIEIAAEADLSPMKVIGRTLHDDLLHARVTYADAAQGSGKSYESCLVAVARAEMGQKTAIVLPTTRLAEETIERLKVMGPKLFAANVVSKVFARHLVLGEGDGGDGGAGTCEDDDPLSFPVDERTLIIVTSHPQFGRRGFSRYVRGIWSVLDGFSIVMDEAGAFFAGECIKTFILDFRVRRQELPDGSAYKDIPQQYCLVTVGAGSCNNCHIRNHGYGTDFDRYHVRVLIPPRETRVAIEDAGVVVPPPPDAIVVDPSLMALGEERRMGDTLHASELLAWDGRPIDEAGRMTAEVYQFERAKGGGKKQLAESPLAVIGEILKFGYKAAVYVDRAVELAEDGKPQAVSAEALREKLTKQSLKELKDTTVFPLETCEKRTLVLTDTLPLEQLRRVAVKQGVGIGFVGATISRTAMSALHHVFPELVVHHHPYPDRKIQQVALVYLDDHHGSGALLDRKTQRLITWPLEDGTRQGLVFLTKKDRAMDLYDAVKSNHPSCWLVVENDEWIYLRKPTLRPEPVQVHLSYSRGPLGRGANIPGGLDYLVFDALAKRPITSLRPGELTPEEFEADQAEERIGVLLENLGRGIRGDKGRLLVAFVLNADKYTRAALERSRVVLEGSVLPPVITSGRNMAALVEEADRWLKQGGGDWPQPDPTAVPTKNKGGRKVKKTPEYVLAAAETALAEGMSWKEFRIKHHPQRHLNAEQQDALKKRFTDTGSQNYL